jgi:dephospho-CoA kinase
MLKVGVTGGMPCGKSFVGEVLRGYGCLLIQADELGHAVLEPGGEAYDDVVREFGRRFLANGPDRSAGAGGAGFRRAGAVGARSTGWCIRRCFAGRMS